MPLSSSELLATRKELSEWVFERPTGCSTIWYVNPYTYALLEGGAFRTASEDRYVADGNLMAKVLTRDLGKNCESLNFDFSGCASEILARANENGLRLALVGAKQNELETFRCEIEKLYPRLQIIFSTNGFFDMPTAQPMIQAMLDSDIDMILISMGSPRQEYFCSMIKDLCNARLQSITMITCGAFFSQIADRGPSFYPDWATKWNLRWLFRLGRERRTFLRILRFYIPFIFRYYIFRQKFPYIK